MHGKVLLIKQGLSQKKLAERLQWDAPKLSQVLNGKRIINKKDAQSFSRAIGKPIPALFHKKVEEFYLMKTS